MTANNDCMFVRYVNNKKLIAGAFMDGSVILYNAKTLDQEVCLADAETNNINNATTYVSFAKETNTNLITCTYSGGIVKIWDFLTGFCRHTVKEKRQTYGVQYHPKISKFFTYGDDGKIFLYDTETQKKEFTYQKSERNRLDGHVSKIFAMKFHPINPNEFLTGGWDSTVYCWDARCQHAVRHISDVFLGGDGIFFNRLGTEVVTCEWKQEDPLKIWDYNTGSFIQTVQSDMEKCHLYCGAYLDDSLVATGGSDSNMFRIINIKTHTTLSYIKNLPAGVYNIDTQEYSKKFLAQNLRFDDFAEIPIIIFSCGKCIYEIRFR